MIGKVTQCDSVHTLVEPKMYEMLKSYLDSLGVDTEDTDSISPRLSMLRLDEFGAPSGYMLVEEPDDDSVEVSYFVNTGSEEAAIQLVTGLCNVLRSHDMGDRKLIFTDKTGHTSNLVGALTGEARHTYDLLRLVDSCARRLQDNVKTEQRVRSWRKPLICMRE